jgi:hypothetical protein
MSTLLSTRLAEIEVLLPFQLLYIPNNFFLAKKSRTFSASKQKEIVPLHFSVEHIGF